MLVKFAAILAFFGFLRCARAYKSPIVRCATARMLFSTSSESFGGNFRTQWHDSVGSTMDVARDYIDNLTTSGVDEDSFAIMAGKQSNGRGTRGRTWSSSEGNLFLTFAIKTAAIATPLQLTPLRVGSILFDIIQPLLAEPHALKLKWPNDVLVGGLKLCGILIEVVGDYTLIGVGCNVGSIPNILPSGSDGGRAAVCLSTLLVSNHSFARESGAIVAPDVTAPGPAGVDAPRLARHVGDALCQALYAWVETSATDSAKAIVNDFDLRMDRGMQRTRPESGEPTTVIPQKVNPDGTLSVVTDMGVSKTLVTDYLY